MYKPNWLLSYEAQRTGAGETIVPCTIGERCHRIQGLDSPEQLAVVQCIGYKRKLSAVQACIMHGLAVRAKVSVTLRCKENSHEHGLSGKKSNRARTDVKEKFLQFVDSSCFTERRIGGASPEYYFDAVFNSSRLFGLLPRMLQSTMRRCASQSSGCASINDVRSTLMVRSSVILHLFSMC